MQVICLLALILDKKGVSVYRLEEDISVTRKNINRYIKNEFHRIDIDSLLPVFEYLEVKFEDVFKSYSNSEAIDILRKINILLEGNGRRVKSRVKT